MDDKTGFSRFRIINRNTNKAQYSDKEYYRLQYNYACNPEFCPLDLYIFNEYIGRNDDAGLPVYDGDIVHYTFDYDDEKLKRKAKRRVGFVGWCKEHLAWEISDEPKEKHGLVFGAGYFFIVEKIGNIYENKQLVSSTEFSVVRFNLMNRMQYSPYCGAGECKAGMPRTTFDKSRGQFVCRCGWASAFPEDFISDYKKKWDIK